MHIELVMTGDELLDGRVLNSNARDIAQALADKGLGVKRALTVGDDPQDLHDAFVQTKHADAVIITGGLGPTDDDRTAALLAEVVGVPLKRNPDALKMIQDYFASRERPMAQSNEKMADLPQGARILENPWGTAPAFEVSLDGCSYFALPGVPREMRNILQQSVLPTLLARCPQDHIVPLIHTIKCFGEGESNLADQLQDLYPLPEGVSIGYRATYPEVHIKLSVACTDPTEAEQRRDTLRKHILKRLGRFVFGENDETMLSSLAECFRTRNATLALAESCTGGLIAAKITELSGASDYFQMSAVTYSNEAKHTMLGVPNTLLAAHGAVSEPVAIAMAEGARHVAKTDLAAAVTGIAGPGGGSEEKPVGTVFIAIASAQGASCRAFRFHGDRQRIQIQTAHTVYDWLRRHLQSDDPTELLKETMRYERS